MQEKQKIEQSDNAKKQSKQERYHVKHKLVLSWIKADLKELLKRLGNGSITKGSEIALNVLLQDGSVSKAILTNKPD